MIEITERTVSELDCNHPKLPAVGSTPEILTDDS